MTGKVYCRRLCNAGCTVYALEYTHSPWPAPLNNVHAALSHLSGIHEDLILSGTGNGASMLLSLLQRVGTAGVGGVILLTPWCLHPAFGAPQEPALDPLGLVDAAGAYKAYGAAPEEASPLLGEIGVGWPRTLVLLCTLDPAFWEGERLVDKIRGAGGEVKVLVKEGFPAGFWGWPRFEGAADMAGSVVEWVLGRKVEVGRAEGRERWGERKLCRVEGCGCWM